MRLLILRWLWLLLFTFFLIGSLHSYWAFSLLVRLLLFFSIFYIVIIACVFLTIFDARAHAAAILLIILAVHDGGRVVGRRVDVWVGEQRLDRGENGADVVDGRPHVLQNVQTNRTIRVNVWMEHFSQELDFRCFIRVFLCELNCEVETSAIPNGVIWTENDGLPVE